MATSTPPTNTTAPTTSSSSTSDADAEAGEGTAKPPLLSFPSNSTTNGNSSTMAEATDALSQLRFDGQQTPLIRPPHIRSVSSTSIPIPARDDQSLHHRPTSGTGAEVYAGSDEDSTAPNSPKAADFETRAAIRAAKEEKPVGVGAKAVGGAAGGQVPAVQGGAAGMPPTSGHAITAAKLFNHRYFAAGDSATPSEAGSDQVAGSTIATPGGSEPAYTPPEMSRQSSGTMAPVVVNAVAVAPAAPIVGEAVGKASTAPTSGTVRRPTVGKEAAPKMEKVAPEKKSMFGKLFDKKDGVNGTSDSESGSGMGKMLGRKPSGKKTANGDANGASAPGAEMARQVSGGAASVGGSDKKPALGRAATDKTDGEKSSKFREMVGMAPKLGRKASSSKGGRSDDGKSDDGGDNRSRGGSQATASLLKKYGVCEKAAIGKGATAVVRLAHKWDRGTDKLYAVKEFRKRRKGESEKEYVKKLTSEFCISSTLHHENVVETVDLVQDENHHWCEVMEYCPGGDLYAAIKRGDMSQAEINSYFKQILSGVTYLHSMGVAHRDIKPENLLLDSLGRIKITDFGVSDVFRMCWEKTTHLSKGLCGSEPYLPKEMFERKEYDARLVDVWACAVVFYCCCMQELPWRVAKPSDPSFSSFLQSYPQISPAPLSNLQRESRAVIKKMLQPEPEKRLQMEDVMADVWVKGLEVIEVNVPTMTFRERV